MPKKTKIHTLLLFPFSKRGGSDMYIILVIFLFFLFGSTLGGQFLKFNKNTSGGPISTSNQCCDTGNGEDCKPQGKDTTGDESKQFKYNNQDYGLLKTNVTLAESLDHLKDTGELHDNNPIVVNTTDSYVRINGQTECRENTNDDQIWKDGSCFPIKNDELIYVCTQNCQTVPDATCSIPTVSCFGNATSKYDIYMRLSDYQRDGVPEPIKNCPTTQTSTNPQAQMNNQQIVAPPVGKEQELQLKTFKVSSPGSSSWISPYCKPAIYLYPQTEEDVHVQVAPKGTLALTIPQYPEGGWYVHAKPNGEIISNNATFPYLYYEAQIPNNLIVKPEKGYVVKKDELKPLFDDVLPKLGLNASEQKDFETYWLSVLPTSNYYFVGIAKQSYLDFLAPLTISPKPDTTLRVTLYFQALDHKETAEPPMLTPITRTGFTVVEWGGLFHKDPAHPFTCFM